MMKPSKILLYIWLCLMIFNRDYSLGYRQEEMALVDLSHSIILTSPLRSGSNSSEILLSDFSKEPTCIVTLPLLYSWILIDFGFQISNISQIRLVTDYFLDNSNEFLDDIEVGLAKYLPHSIVQNSNFTNTKYFTYCGSTGTVSKDTTNVVVDCISSLSARWALIKRKGPLNLCYVQILQTSVKPQCFQRLQIQNSFYKKAKENLSVFRSNRHSTFLKCLQNCETESKCNAVAFMSLKNGEGICQFLRFRDSLGDSICDESCSLIINRCQLGKSVRLKNSERSNVLKISTIKNNSFVISIELNGVTSCNSDKCGNVILLLKDVTGKQFKCGTVDPLMDRILIRTVFMCEKPIKNPQVLIIKNKSRIQKEIYDFTSISIRFVEEDSLSLKYLQITNTFKMTTESSHPTYFTKDLTTYDLLNDMSLSTSANRITSIQMNEKDNTQSTIQYSKFTKNLYSSTVNIEKKNFDILKKATKIFTKTYTNVPTEIESSTKNIKIKGNPIIERFNGNKSRKQNSIKQNNLKTFEENSTTQSSKSTMKYSKLIISTKTNNKILYKQGTKNNINTMFKTTPVKVIFSTKRKEIISKYTIQIRKALQTTNSTYISLDQYNKSYTILLNNETNFSLKTITSKNNYVQYVWLIIIVFGSILVSVTAIVVMISYIEVKRKVKKWDIPVGGFCPSNPDSESITTHSSIHMSIIRKPN